MFTRFERRSAFRGSWLLLLLAAFIFACPTGQALAQEEPVATVEATATEVADTAVTATAEAVEAVPEAAPEEPAAPSYVESSVLDGIWLMLTGTLVMFMQAGFAMVETGLTRAKNAINIMAKNLLDFCFGSLLFWVVGYAIMYGTNSGGGLFGFSSEYLFMGSGLDIAGNADGFANAAGWFFQMVFCATAATIVSGAMAERTKLSSYILYSCVISAIIYPISGHWIWGGGWLGAMPADGGWGMRDFAGSTVVHSVGAWAALAGAIMVGPRLGKYNKDGTANAIPGHNIVLAALGVFILWFGWYGFNPGSTLACHAGVSYIAVTTTVAASAGSVAALFCSWIKFGKPDVTMALNGVLAGLVGITAPCASVEPWAAVVIGFIAGILVFCSVLFVERVLKIDDPVGAVSVHGVCGAWGTISIGIFGSQKVDVLFWDDASCIKDGLLYGGGVSQLITQIVGVVAVFIYVFVAALILFAILKYTIGLRVSDVEQIEGLDLGEHDMAAYPDFQVTNIKSYQIREA
ncbi:MAG: ammonium transporter [Phycisphaera sp.]|nr:ammonium transporter [Phycisphaera sp.]